MIITKGKLYCCMKFLFIPFEGFVSLNTQYCEKFQLNLTFIASCFVKASWKKFLLKANKRLKRRKREIILYTCNLSLLQFFFFDLTWNYFRPNFKPFFKPNGLTFNNVIVIFCTLFQHANEDVEKMILGNKCDMDDRRVVSKERGDQVGSNWKRFPW